MAARFLEVSGLHGWYGESHVLHGVDFHVDEGEVVTLLGRNGAGRTSTLRAIMGLIGTRKGSIKVRGTETIGLPTHRIARLGLGYCPEERGIFSSLSAEENLMLPPTLAEGGMSVEQIYAMFPNLRERATSQGTRLSGGEQQMLAVARILRTGARLLLLDEPTQGMGLEDVDRIRQLIKKVAASRTVLMVEHNMSVVASIADTIAVLQRGATLAEGPYAEVSKNPAVIEAYMGSAGAELQGAH